MKTPQFPDKLHRPHETKTRNLNRRGRKTRTAVTAAEVAFCAYLSSLATPNKLLCRRATRRGGATNCSKCPESSLPFESSKDENRTKHGTQQGTESC